MNRDYMKFTKLAASMLFVGMTIILTGCGKGTEPINSNTIPEQTMALDSVFSSDLTWAEYEALSPSEKELFFDSFPSVGAFDAWLQSVTRETVPWEEGEKLPSDYTWEEFEALSPAMKELFFDSFNSLEEFDSWKVSAQQHMYLPWEDGGIQPWEYSWDEYDLLSSRQKEAFFDWFGSVEAFDAWMNGAWIDKSEPYPWERDEKDLYSYTWNEYEAFTPSEKEAFFDAFASVEDFDRWLLEAQTHAECNWEKNLEDYTWEEYEEMTPSQKELFFDSFDSLESFNAWMDSVNP